MGTNYTPEMANELAQSIRDYALGKLLQFAAEARADEKAKTSVTVSLMTTIRENVGNKELSDSDFRLFVRNCLEVQPFDEWLPISTAPKTGVSVKVTTYNGYTHAFYQDGVWWWHNVHSGQDGDYAAGPTPLGWKAY